jgi:hypothetical protein
MKMTNYLILAVAGAALFLTQPVFAANDAVKTMANILIHLEHYPSDSEKGQLREIVNGSASQAEKDVAQAIINLQHQATDADKKKLSNIMDDSSVPEDVRTLASIVHNLNHKPTSSDKEKLKAMM